MCGINGIVSWRRDTGVVIENMNRHLHHRGPDGEGIFKDAPLALGHVRLSILDLTAAGAQPMIFDRLVLILNGEIYNFKSLRETLVANGYEFTSRSDTEVLLKAWHFWGKECLAKLQGMFAFAVYDGKQKNLFLCRDSYGVKPLFYSIRSEEVLFSSELSTLINAQAVRPEVDHDALASYLALHYVPAPQTGLKGLLKLPAGHLLCISFENNHIITYRLYRWDKPFVPHDCADGITVEALDQALEGSIRQQMVSDVPVGAFLSGGVDSSLVCHYASKVHKEPLHTFSIGFTDAGPEYDESRYAAKAATLIGAHHHAVCVELGSLCNYADEVLSMLGELNADSSVFLNYIVCAAAREHVTVCLSGAGGDELFGGYYRYQALLSLGILKRIPQPAIWVLRSLLSPLPQNRDSRMGNFVRRIYRFLDQRDGNKGFLELCRQDKAYPQQSSFLDQEPIYGLLKALEFDFRYYLCDNIFSFSDKMSMLHGLEVRVPFLDPGVIGLAERMRNSQRVTRGEKKILLKQLAVHYFPRELIYRQKQGFAAPLEVWLRKMPVDRLKKLCLGGLASQVVPESLIVELVDAFYCKSRDLSLQLYALIVMNKWFERI